jgi:hypothetical protein
MRLAAVIPALVLIGTSASLVGADEAPKLTFSGRFTLNAAQSEDAREKMRAALGHREGEGAGSGGGRPMGGGHGGGSWGGHGGGGGAHHRPEGGTPGQASGQDPREAMRAVFEAPAELTITDTDSEVVVLEKDGRVRTLHPDGKSEKSESSGDEIKTRRDGGRLIVETKTAQGGKIIETFARDPEHRQIQMTLVLESPSRPSLSIRRVYDEAPPES